NGRSADCDYARDDSQRADRDGTGLLDPGVLGAAVACDALRHFPSSLPTMGSQCMTNSGRAVTQSRWNELIRYWDKSRTKANRNQRSLQGKLRAAIVPQTKTNFGSVIVNREIVGMRDEIEKPM